MSNAPDRSSHVPPGSEALAQSGAAALERALAMQQRGDWAGAQACYEALLHEQPRHLDALNALAMIAYQSGHADRAIELIDRAIEVDPLNPAFYSNRGILLQERQRMDEAIASYDQAIGLQPDFAQAYGNRAIAQMALRRYEEAVASCTAAIAALPDYAEAHHNRALALKALGRLDEALQSCAQAIAIRPDYVDALFCRGGLLHELGQHAAALTSYERVIALKPDHAEAHSNRGLALQALGRTDEALASFDRLIAIRPDFADAHHNRGVLLQTLKRFEAAVGSYERAIAINPNYAQSYSNRGVVLQALGQPDAAIADYGRALSLQPQLAEAHANLGTALQDQLRMDEAMASYDRALAIEPDHALAHWNRGLACLLQGNFAQGWAGYEWRWKVKILGIPKREFCAPLWLGKEPLAGKTILLHAEQGLGDTIQLCRYVPIAAALGARVILEVQPPLLGLLARLEGVAALVGRGGALPTFDFHCPLLSLPLAFQTQLDSIPPSPRTLRSDADKLAQWRATLGGKTQPRVGLVWSGNPGHPNDRNRSVALAQLLEHLPEGYDYISLQKEVRAGDRAVLDAHPKVRHFGDALVDFTHTAALCSLMDRVISVDTSVAHLSAALGTPTWILVPFGPDWRWMLDRTDSPWYPSVKLYRQDRSGDWAPALDRIGADLQRRAGGAP